MDKYRDQARLNLGEKLSPCITKLMSELFTNGSLDLSLVRLHTGIPKIVSTFVDIQRGGAVTLGYDSFFKDGWKGTYNADHLGALTTVMEERWHSLQAKQVMDAGGRWENSYMAASTKAWLHGGDSYNDNPYEIEAKNVAGQMRAYMLNIYGSDPCATIGLAPH